MIDNFKVELFESFKSQIINQKKNELENLLQNSYFKDQVIESSMDLLSIICENIEEKMIDFNNKDDIYCNLINYIAENGNPKEVICILNVHLDKVNVDFKFLILLYPLSIALLKLDFYNSSSLVIIKDSLNCVVSYFNNLPVAHYKGLEGEELEVYIQTSETQRILRLSKAYLGFVEFMTRNKKLANFKSIKDEIVRNILFLFDKSLIKLAFYAPGIVSDESRSCSLRAFKLIEKLVSCFHDCITNICSTNEKQKLEFQTELLKEQEIIPYSSLVCLLYHVFVLQNFQKYPQVFLPIYNWNFSIPILSICLSKSQDPHCIRLCLRILDEFYQRIELSTISWKRPVQLSLFRSLKTAMTSNFNREIRGFSFNIFVKSFERLVDVGRFKLLRTLLKEVDHFGVKGQLILMLKKEIINGIMRKDDSIGYFIGSSVYPLISDIFTLPDADKTDVVDESEWILAALNMLYVLIHRDKQHLVGLDVLIHDFRNDFIQPLVKATEIAIGHYNNEKRLIESDEQASAISELRSELAFMDKEQKIDFVNRAILVIELVRCNISRITNLIL